jgi:hypothetical protein
MIVCSSGLAIGAFYRGVTWHAGPMRANRWAVAAAVALAVAACGSDGEDPAGSPSASTGSEGQAIEVEVADGPSLATLSDVRCHRVDDTQLVADGIVTSKGDDTRYVSLQVRFVDEDGVRVELATDTVSDLLVGESARWSATTYADGAADVRRCEVTATVS